VRSEVPAGRALRESNLLSDEELWLFSAEDTGALVGSTLHVVALRRRRRLARRRTILRGLVAPFGFGALTVVLDPLLCLITGEDFVWPLLRGLLALLLLAIAAVVGVPALLRRPRVLGVASTVPGLRGLAALYAEEELTTALVPFVDGGEVRAAGFPAAVSLLGWSPLGQALRAPVPTLRSPPEPVVMGGLEPLAGKLSLATHLAVVGGVASKRLAERLTRQGESIARTLTARLRLTARIGAYTLVVLVSIGSLVHLIARGLPGMSLLPGGAATPDEKELQDLLKQLE
jgi:hypothetical protein